MKWVKLIALTVVFTFFQLACKNANVDKDFEDGKISFQSVNKVPVVEGTLNGKKVFYIIDTGASLSILDLSQQEDYDFHYRIDVNEGVAGIGGVSTLGVVSNAEAEIGGVKIDVPLKTQDLSAVKNVIQRYQGVKIIGIIGSDYMKRHNIVIDYSNNEIRKITEEK